MPSSFSDTARSERQFATMLLPHLLMADDFAGAAALFEHFALAWEKDIRASDIEVVAELNPIRDVAKASQETKGDVGDVKAVVPDLFIRNGSTALIIEAKFFTHPSSHALAEQLAAQEAAIRRTLPSTVYESCKFHYLSLTVLPIENVSEWPPSYRGVTWDEILEILAPVICAPPSADKEYAISRIRQAIARSKKEAETVSAGKGRARTIQELLAHAPNLLASGYRYIGFVGGMNALANADLNSLENRGHYKYSDCQPNPNWIPLIAVATKYLELKAKSHA